MKKRNIFSRQAVNFLWVLLGLGAGLQFIEVIWAASKGYLGFFSMMVVIVTEMVITGSIYVIIYKFLIKHVMRPENYSNILYRVEVFRN